MSLLTAVVIKLVSIIILTIYVSIMYDVSFSKNVPSAITCNLYLYENSPMKQRESLNLFGECCTACYSLDEYTIFSPLSSIMVYPVDGQALESVEEEAEDTMEKESEENEKDAMLEREGEKKWRRPNISLRHRTKAKARAHRKSKVRGRKKIKEMG